MLVGSGFLMRNVAPELVRVAVEERVDLERVSVKAGIASRGVQRRGRPTTFGEQSTVTPRSLTTNLHSLSSLQQRRGFGSVPPVANIFRIYSARVDEKDRDDLAEWVLANTVNDYCPYGTNNYGARGLAELKEKGEASAARKRATAGHERARFEDARNQKSLQATARLPNALLRKDAMAVAALLAKGAETDALGASGKSAREVAKDLGIEEWLSGKATDEQ